MSDPKPYVPPNVQAPAKVLHGQPAKDAARPWRALRPGETERQWHTRMSHTCWQCGVYIVDNEALDRHEEAEH